MFEIFWGLQNGQETLSSKIIELTIAAVLGFIASYALEVIKRRREPLSRISYDVAVDELLPPGSEKKSDKLVVMYDERPVSGVFKVACKVSNVGNRTIRRFLLRFQLSAGANAAPKMLESKAVGTLPEQELTEISGQVGTAESRWKFDQLAPKDSVDFSFLVDSNTSPLLVVYPKYEGERDDNEIEIVRKSTKRIIAEDEDAVAGLLFFGALYFVIPPLAFLVPISELNAALEQVIRIVVLVPLLRYLPRGVRAIAKSLRAGNSLISIGEISGTGNVDIKADRPS